MKTVLPDQTTIEPTGSLEIPVQDLRTAYIETYQENIALKAKLEDVELALKESNNQALKLAEAGKEAITRLAAEKRKAELGREMTDKLIETLVLFQRLSR